LFGLLLLSVAEPSRAVPYATSVTNSAGTVSFRLNENADNVLIVSGGGSVTNDLGPGVKGLTVKSLGIGAGPIKVVVSRSAAAGYTQLSDDGFQDQGTYVNKFEQPRGVTVDRNPASPSFGRIYVANGRGEASTGGSFVRTTFQGVYMLNADNTAALDTAFVPRTAGLGFTPGNTATPYRLHIGKDDHRLYICDWSDPSGGLWTTDLDVESGVNVLQGIGDLNAGSLIHGSVPAVWVEGTAGSNLKVFTVDEDLVPFNSLWKYDIGATALPFEGAGTLIGSPAVTSSSQTMDMVRGGAGNYFYVTQRRAAGTEANVLVLAEDGTVVTNSLSASREFLGNPAAVDLLRETLAVDISPDGSTLALLRANITPTVLLVPLTNGGFNFAGTNGFNVGSTSVNNRDIAFDAAGNVYVVNTSAEWMRIFSKGGSTVATTGTDGSFSITTPPVLVSVAASVPTANEQGPVAGQFTLTRTGGTAEALTVSYSMGGTAVNGGDYAALSGTVTFQPGAASTNIAIAVVDDSIAEFTETAVMSVVSGNGYSIGTASATLSIVDNEPTEISFSTTATNELLESYAPSRATLFLARRGLLSPAVTINLVYSGTATAGADFNAPSTVDLAASATTAQISLTPVNDQAFEGNELVVAQVAPGGASYTVGATNSAYVLVIDDETPSGTVLFSDKFDVDSTGAWQVNLADPSDGSVDFAWDYGTLAGIPPAPGTTDGTTKGMRFRCGNTFPQPSGVSVSPLGGNFTGDYRLKFDFWLNYNGPIPDGGPGSTQHFDAGVGTSGNTVQWFNNPASDGVWFICSGDGADGGTFGDYSAYIGLQTMGDDSGFYAAGYDANPNSGLRDNGNFFYASRWGGQTAPAAQLALYPGQTGAANRGNAGMAWHSVVITKSGDTVEWKMDGVVICTVTNDPSGLSTNVFVGIQDRFAGSLSNEPEMSFGLVDNLRVEAFVSAPIRITGIAIIGSNVEITFTGAAGNKATDFKLQSAGAVDGTFSDDNAAVLTDVGPGQFKATRPVGGANPFYKIKL
jgi:hypothetical protein